MEPGELIQKYQEEYDQELKALEEKSIYDLSLLDQNRQKCNPPFIPLPFLLKPFCYVFIPPPPPLPLPKLNLLGHPFPFIRDRTVLHVSTYSKETNKESKNKEKHIFTYLRYLF